MISTIVLTGCAGQSTQDDVSATPPAEAAEAAYTPKVWLDVTNGSDQNMNYTVTSSCDDTLSDVLVPNDTRSDSGSCTFGADIKMSIDGYEIRAYPDRLELKLKPIGSCTWGAGVDSASPGTYRNPSGTDTADSATCVSDDWSVDGNQPANDTRYHWMVTVR